MRISDWSSDVCSSDLAAADNLEDRYRQQSDAARAAAQKAVQAAKDKAARDAEKRLAKVDSDLAGKMAAAEADEIGRASCRERVCQYVLIAVGAESLKKKQTGTHMIVYITQN